MKPVILISSCGGPDRPGDGLYNGGVKAYNMLAKLLIQHGYDAYIVTWDGTYTPWLAEYQPYISLERATQIRQREGHNIRLVTGWLDSPAFLALASNVGYYYIDHEVSWTAKYLGLLDGRIRKIAVTNATARMWYAMELGRRVDIINIWLDGEHWQPNPAIRVPGRIGYMPENTFLAGDMAQDMRRVELASLYDLCQTHSAEVLDLAEHSPSERDLIRQMQACDIYVGFGRGKHHLWGEGGPAMHLEAMLAGCAVAAYDAGGNREYLLHGYNGLMAPTGDIQTLCGYVRALLQDQQLKERIRKAGIALATEAFTARYRWPLVQKFLELEGV